MHQELYPAATSIVKLKQTRLHIQILIDQKVLDYICARSIGDMAAQIKL
jgi:hypothetical protein